MPKTTQNYHLIVKIRADPSLGRVDFMGEECEGMGKE